MKLFIGFLLACFFGAVVFRKQSSTATNWMLFALCLLVTIGYFFFRQI